MNYEELYNKYLILEAENKRLKEELEQLKVKLISETPENYRTETNLQSKVDLFERTESMIDQSSSNKDKIELFLSLFRGRTDVCAKRWKNKPGYSPYCYNDFKSGICNKPKINALSVKIVSLHH